MNSRIVGRIAAAARPGRPWLRITAPPWLARILIAAGTQPAPADKTAIGEAAISELEKP